MKGFTTCKSIQDICELSQISLERYMFIHSKITPYTDYFS